MLAVAGAAVLRFSVKAGQSAAALDPQQASSTASDSGTFSSQNSAFEAHQSHSSKSSFPATSQEWRALAHAWCRAWRLLMQAARGLGEEALVQLVCLLICAYYCIYIACSGLSEVRRERCQVA